MRTIHALLFLSLVAISSNAKSQEETEYFFVWNGDPSLVENIASEDQELRFGNHHKSECDLEVSRAAAVAGTRDVVLRTGRKIFVPNMSRMQARDLWLSCMASKGWEPLYTESSARERRNELRSNNVHTFAVAFSKHF